MVSALARFFISLLQKSTDGNARTTPTGISGRVGLPIRILSLIPVALLITFASFAIKDADPEDRQTGYFLMAGATVLIGVSLHLFTYRIFTHNHLLIAGSLLMKEREIDLDQQFSLNEKDDGIMILSQDRKNIKIVWNVKGHHDFCDVALAAYEKLEGS